MGKPLHVQAPSPLLLLPLAAGLLGSALRSKDRRFVEHLVTLVHVHAFAFLVWAPVGPVRLSTGVDLGGAVAMLVVWYVLRAFKTVYGPLSLRLWVNVAGGFLPYFVSITMALGLLGIVGAD